MPTYPCSSPLGKLPLKQHLHFVILQEDEGGQEGGEPVFRAVRVEGGLEDAEDVFSQRAEDALDDDGGDLVVDIRGEGVDVFVEGVLGVHCEDLLVGPTRLGPASPLGLEEAAGDPESQRLFEHLVLHIVSKPKSRRDMVKLTGTGKTDARYAAWKMFQIRGSVLSR